MLNVPESAFYYYWEGVHRIIKADMAGNKIDALTDRMVKEGRMTADEKNDYGNWMNDCLSETERQRFIEGVRFGVQFMAFAMQENETNE